MAPRQAAKRRFDESGNFMCLYQESLALRADAVIYHIGWLAFNASACYITRP